MSIGMQKNLTDEFRPLRLSFAYEKTNNKIFYFMEIEIMKLTYRRDTIVIIRLFLWN